MRTVARAVAVGLILALLALAAGCKAQPGGSGAFTGEYQALALADAPKPLQDRYEQTKAVPGLTVYQEGGQTYLLLTAGRVDQPDLMVDVLTVEKPAGGSKDVRVLAILRPGNQGQSGGYPYALLVLDGGKGLTYKARLTTRSEVPLELPGIPLTGQ